MRFHTIDGAELERELASERKPFVLDVRTREAYLGGHIPGSAHILVYDLGHERQRLPSSMIRRIVMIGEPGKRTNAGATFLTLMGYADVAVLDGGIDGWAGEIEVGEPPEPVAKGGPELRILPRDQMPDASSGENTEPSPNS